MYFDHSLILVPQSQVELALANYMPSNFGVNQLGMTGFLVT